MPKQSLKKDSSDTIQPTARVIKVFKTFPKGISTKVNLIAWLEF